MVLLITWIWLLYLVEDVEWGRVAFLDGEDEGQGNDGLLAAGERRDVGELVGAVEADQDREANHFLIVPGSIPGANRRGGGGGVAENNFDFISAKTRSKC